MVLLRNNQLNPTLNIPNIQRDFSIYKFSEDTLDFKNAIIDNIKYQFNARSVVYIGGKNIYALFDKKENESEFKKDLYSLKEGSNKNLEIQIVSNIYNEFSRFESSKRYLVQLLFNILGTAKKDDSYNNITGKLFYIVDYKASKVNTEGVQLKQYITLHINIDKNLNLNLNVQTFTNLIVFKLPSGDYSRKIAPLPRYTLDDKTRLMRRLQPTDNVEEASIFIPRSKPMNGKQSHIVPFLQFKNDKEFMKSKMGILNKFIEAVKNHLGDYITVEFKALPEPKWSDDLNPRDIRERIKNFYQSNPIIIEDCLKNEASRQLSNILKTALTYEKGIFSVTDVREGTTDVNAINLRLVDSPNSYKEQNLEDPYQTYNDRVVHHLIVENFYEKSAYKIKQDDSKEKVYEIWKAPIHNVLKECYLKRDLITNQVSLIDWHYGNWTFALPQIIKEEDDDDKTKKAKTEITPFGILDIDEQGKMQCSYAEHVFQINSIEHRTLVQNAQMLQSSLANDWNANNKLYGLLKSPNGVTMAIFETEQYTLVDFQGIAKDLDAANEDPEYSVETWQNWFEEFFQINTFITEKLFLKIFDSKKSSDLLLKSEILTLLDDFITIQLKKKRPNSTALKGRFNSFYKSKTGKCLISLLRGKEVKDDLFGATLGIKFWINKEGNDIEYFVGTKSEGLQSSLPRATRIRKIKMLDATQKLPDLSILLKMMDNDFVQWGDLTVVPFPFKYLREWLANISKQKPTN